jgi:hypothetical protein
MCTDTRHSPRPQPSCQNENSVSEYNGRFVGPGEADTWKLSLNSSRWLRLVHRDDKPLAAVRALCRGKQDHGSRPLMDSLLLAVWADDQMLVETEIDEVAFCHGCVFHEVR